MQEFSSIKIPSEQLYRQELEILKKVDKGAKPPGWQLTPASAVDYILGDKEVEGIPISAKYFGNRSLVEVAVATLATDRALLLIGVPGTAKTLLSEHLAAAISGQSHWLVQGTAGMSEDQLRYSWNYAQLLSKGPGWEALVPSPVFHAMEKGCIVRVEELTRMPSDVQDSLITLLSEKTLPIPELNESLRAKKGFNLIATANDRDKGVQELSSALQRRFNTVKLPLPASFEEEVRIVINRSKEMEKILELPPTGISNEEIRTLVTIFRELRGGETLDQSQKIRSPQATLSPAEIISVVQNSKAMAAYFPGRENQEYFVPSLIGAVIKDPQLDRALLQEYNENVVRNRPGWEKIYAALRWELNPS
jgi:MoxR-like ATPase